MYKFYPIWNEGYVGWRELCSWDVNKLDNYEYPLIRKGW